MILQLGDDGVVSSVNEEDLIYVDKNELEQFVDKYHQLEKLNEQLKKENEYFKELLDRYEIESSDFDKFMNSGENIRLSINIETGELQRHIYASGQWFGDFDRVLCENWISKEDYQKFIDRVIEVYNTEFKGELES